MSDRIDIELQDKVNPEIKNKIIGIAEACERTDSALSKLQRRLASIDSNALTKLADASAKNQNALAREMNAQARLTMANSKAAAMDAKAALAKQKLATEIERTTAAKSKAELAALRLSNAQNKVSQSTNTAASSFARYARTAAAVVGLGLSAKALIDAADAYTNVQNKLKMVTNSEQQLATVTEEVFNIAKRTRAPVDETSRAFQRFDLAMQQLGASQQESLQLTETVNKAMIVAGATTTEMSSGLLQLSQAFNKGKLDGDEFRTVMELMPPVADAIAKQLGVTRGALLKLAPEGKITAEVMRKAFAAAREEIAGKFAKAMPTIAQAFVVLRNEATRFFGQLDKATGTTASISKAILWLADNFKIVGVALATLTALLVAAFGPWLLGILAAATKAVLGFTLALATNPIGALIVGLTAAISYIALFGDQVKMSEDGLVTLKDTALAVWSYIKEGAGVLLEYLKDGWNAAIDWINNKTDGWGEQFRNIGNFILEAMKKVANTLIGVWIGAYRAVISGWSLFPSALKDIFATALNSVIGVIEAIVNAALTGINKILSTANDIREFAGLGRSFNENLSVSLDDFKMEVGGAAKDLAKTVDDAFKSAIDVDYIGNAVDAINKRAEKISQDRRRLEQGQGGGLRGTGPAALPSILDGKAAKAAERRALTMEKINAQLDKEIQRLFILKPEREVQQKLDQIETNLISKKIKLTDEERDSIRAKLKAVEDAKVVQQAFDKVYEQAVGPARDYSATLQASDKLLQMGAISLDQYKRAITAAYQEYEKASNPLYEVNKEIDNQLQLLRYVGPELEIQQQLQQATNALLEKGVVLNEQERLALQRKYETIQRGKSVQSELNKIYQETIGAQQSLVDKNIALNLAYQQGMLGLDAYKARLGALRIEATNLRLEMGQGGFTDVMTASLGKMVEGYKSALSGLASAFGDFFVRLQDGFANSIGRAIVYSEDLGDALTNVAKEAIAGLISALVKLGIQYVMMQILGESMAAAGLATTAALAGAAAAAWAPAAAFASLATLGTNAAPASAALTGTLALSKGLALVSAVTGFEEGGFTGNIGRKEIAGVVHGQEFVMNAEATARNRDVLEAMNSGAKAVAINTNSGKSGSGGINVFVENYANGVEHEVQQISENEIRIIARDEAKGVVHRDAPGVVASDLHNPNSSTSKALNRNYKVARNR